MGNCMEKHRVDSDDKLFRGGNVQVISGKGQWDDIISKAKKNDKLVVANFSASWCNPCVALAPFYRDLSAHHPSVVFLSIDVDDNEELCTLWEIQATPTFFFLKDGQKMDVHVGANKVELEKKLIKFVDSSSAVGSIGPSSSPCSDIVHPTTIPGTPLVS